MINTKAYVIINRSNAAKERLPVGGGGGVDKLASFGVYGDW